MKAPHDYRHVKRATEWRDRIERINKAFKHTHIIGTAEIKILLFLSQCQDHTSTGTGITQATGNQHPFLVKKLDAPIKEGLITYRIHIKPYLWQYTLTARGIEYLNELERAQRQAKPSRRFATAAQKDQERRIKYIK
jgi:hypothetical protein